jgi:hypothetical protein
MRFDSQAAGRPTELAYPYAEVDGKEFTSIDTGYAYRDRSAVAQAVAR